MASLKRAKGFVRSHRLKEAIEEFDELVKNPETRAAGLGERGWLLLSMGRHAEAVRDFEEIISHNPADLDAKAHLARALRHLGEIDRAASLCVEVLTANPFNWLALEVLDICQRSRGCGRPPVSLTAFDPQTEVPSEPINGVIRALEHDGKSFPTSIYPQVGRFLYALTLCMRPRMVVETGCHIGYSTLCIAQALEDGGAGHLHSFDLFTQDSTCESPILGKCDDQLDCARGHLAHAGLAERVTLHRGDSSEGIRREFAGREKSIDLVFIDGDHTIRGCRRDWDAIEPFLTEEALVVLHDTRPHECKWIGPRFFLENLSERAPDLFHWVNILTLERIGLAFVQRRQPGQIPSWRPGLLESLSEWLQLRTHWGKGKND